MIAELPAPAVAVKPFQVEFDWQIGHLRPWLLTEEIQAALECSDRHVCNLFDDGSIDVVIDIRGKGSKRPCYRALRESFYRYVRTGSRSAAPTNLEAVLAGYLRGGPSVLRSFNLANHFNCSEDHICDLAPHFFTDIASARASKLYVRATPLQVINFAKARRVS